MGLLADGLLLLHFLLGLEGQFPDEAVYLVAVLFLLLSEELGLGLALRDFSFDDLSQLFLLFLAGLAVVNDCIHEAGDVIFESAGDLLHDLRSFPLLFFDLILQHLKLLLHGLHELVLFVLPLQDLAFDLGVELLR